MIKQLVSGNKRRFKEDGFDLDLSYISDRIIAMGFPAQKLEGVYRNHIDDVVRFLESKHKDRYKLYNLCSERDYDPNRFHGRVATNFRFDDHNPPKLEDIPKFCKDVDDWLKQDEKNVVAIHCKAGKGRTGVMICAYLIYDQTADSAEKAMSVYGSKRTSDERGVTIPSQRRYVEYYAKLVTRKITYCPVTLVPDHISFQPLPGLNGSAGCNFYFVIRSHKKREVFRSEPRKPVKNMFEYTFQDRSPRLTGDVKFEFKSREVLSMTKKPLFSFWFNTFFVLYDWNEKMKSMPITSSSDHSPPASCHDLGSNFDDCSCFKSSSSSCPASSSSSSSSSSQQQHPVKPMNGSAAHLADDSITALSLQGDACQKCDHHPHRNHHLNHTQRFGDPGIRLVFTREDLDRVHKLKHAKVFPQDFRVEICFKPYSENLQEKTPRVDRELKPVLSVPSYSARHELDVPGNGSCSYIRDDNSITGSSSDDEEQ